MRYARVLAVVGLLAAVALTAVVLTRTSQAAPARRPPVGPRQQLAAPPLRSPVGPQQFAASPGRSPVGPRQQLQNFVPQLLQQLAPHPRRHAVPVPYLAGPQIGGAPCYAGTGCSIKGCVIPVANAVGPITPSAAAPAATCPLGDRVPRSFRVSGP